MADGDSKYFLKFREIPEQIRSFLMSENVINKRIELVQKYKFTDESALKISQILNKIYDKEAVLSDLHKLFTAGLGVTPENAKQIALDYAGYEFLPISDYLGDVDALIRSLGGDPAKFPTQRIVIRAITPTELVTELLHDRPVNVPAFLEHRLREILESRVRGVRKDDETVARLTRAEKIGGVELPQDEAEKIIAELDSKIASVNIRSDNEPVAVKPVVAPSPAVEASPRQEPMMIKLVDATLHPTLSSLGARGNISKKGDGVTAEDEREADAVREKILPMVVPASLSDLDKEIKTAAESIFAAHGSSLPKDIQERFRSIVISRLKGVRVAAETRELLSRAPSMGGMGFGLGLAGDISAKIEERARIMNSAGENTVNKEKEAFTKASVMNAAAKDDSRKKSEQEEVDRLYGSLAAKKRMAPIAQISSQPPQDRATTLSAPSAKMHDVRAVRPAAPVATQLTGPVEELRNMTVVDFRRLSADPTEACRKLSDKLDLLQEQSYALRIEGVKAWQLSEAHRSYLEIITAAFGGGKPISAAIAEAEAAGKQTLTEREVHAIMEFNRGLKA